jgi:transcriptional regulator with XRE-family HTH domain
MTQEQVARAAGIHRNHDQLLEWALSDRRKQTPANPRLSRLVGLCRVYRTTVPDLVVDIFRPTPDAPGVEYDETGH